MDDTPLSDSDDELIACLLSERDYAIRGEELARGIFAAVGEVAELPDGYAYRFVSDEAILASLLAFIAAERRCCPFLAFELAFLPHGGPIWLKMRGSPRVKAFIAETFPASVDAAATSATPDMAADGGV
jgi:hypothetical protein